MPFLLGAVCLRKWTVGLQRVARCRRLLVDGRSAVRDWSVGRQHHAVLISPMETTGKSDHRGDAETTRIALDEMAWLDDRCAPPGLRVRIRNWHVHPTNVLAPSRCRIPALHYPLLVCSRHHSRPAHMVAHQFVATIPASPHRFVRFPSRHDRYRQHRLTTLRKTCVFCQRCGEIAPCLEEPASITEDGVGDIIPPAVAFHHDDPL